MLKWVALPQENGWIHPQPPLCNLYLGMVLRNQLQLLSKVQWEVWSFEEVLLVVISLSLLGTRDSFFSLSSVSLSIPGSHTLSLISYLVLTIPWWPKCANSTGLLLRVSGMKILFILNTTPLYTENSFFNLLKSWTSGLVHRSVSIALIRACISASTWVVYLPVVPAPTSRACLVTWKGAMGLWLWHNWEWNGIRTVSRLGGTWYHWRSVVSLHCVSLQLS